MNQPIVLNFKDFKNVCDSRRIYYYEGETYFDFHILVDGLIVKTRIIKTEIENPKLFFSDKMFYGAMNIKFNIPIDKGNMFNFILEDDINTFNELKQDEEVKNIDIQKTGIN